jgi:DNA processing protein
MITADEALARGRTILAVPGPIRSPSSTGTNALLREGAAPACDVDDILAALALEGARRPPGWRDAPGEGNQGPPAELAPVLAAVDWAPTSTEQVLIRTGCSPGEVTVGLARLEMDGWVRALGGWWERVGPPRPGPAGPTVDG